MPLTEQNRDNTLNYWWGLDEHKNNLIKWQRENTREDLINNRNSVHAERRRLVQLLLDDYKTQDCGSHLGYFYISASDLTFKQSWKDSDTKITTIPYNNQTLIQLNLPHAVFYEWLQNHGLKFENPVFYKKHHYSSYLSNFGSIPFLPEHTSLPDYAMPLDNVITVTYTDKIKVETLNYWWDLEGNKSTLVKWQRENNQDVLQTNKNTVHTERLRLINLLLNDTFPPYAGLFALNAFFNAKHDHGWQKHPNTSTKYTLDTNLKSILLNVPHNKFNDWIMSHKKYVGNYYRKFTETNYSSYLTNFGSTPFLPEESPIPEYIVFIKDIKNLIVSKTTDTPIFISYKLDNNHAFTKSLKHFEEGILDKLKSYNFIPRIASDSLTQEQCNALIAELKITKPVEYTPRLTVAKLKAIAEHSLYNDTTPLSEFFIVGEDLLVTGAGYSKPQVGDLHIEFLIQAVEN